MRKWDAHRFILSVWLVCNLLLLVGCGKGMEISRRPAGKIVDVKAIHKSFGGRMVQIWTEQRFTLVSDVASVPIGVETFVVDFDSGCQFFTWEGAVYLYPINDEALDYRGWYGNPVDLSPAAGDLSGPRR